ncbi:hypothetical protein N0V86_003352 [Didymella sp. IMI 355093]|nr:hypothetical protein N0V86_003352 [Didymella sp. IMI 355093]
MVQYKDEAEASRHGEVPAPANTLEDQGGVVEPRTAETFSDLFDESSLEIELQHGDMQETDWVLVEAAWPNYINGTPSLVVDQGGEAVTVVAGVRSICEASVKSVAGVKRKQESDEVTLTPNDTISENAELQAETRAQLAQPHASQLIKPDTFPAQPPPVQTRSPTLTNHHPTTARKEPRSQPPVPNSFLSDDDPEKLWCVCRASDYGRMIMCEEPGCRARWFHFGCVGLERSPGRRARWVCGEHRGWRLSRRGGGLA